MQTHTPEQAQLAGLNLVGRETLLLIDGLNIVRRVYEAIPADDSPEKAQSALRASLGSFRRALAEHKPDYALAAFDHEGPTWRHDIYPAYRQGRKPMAQVLRDVLPQFYEQLQNLGMKSLCKPGVEADDVLAATFEAWHKANKGVCVVLSTDKDIAALVAHGALVRDHFKPEWRDEAWVQGKFGVSAARLPDFLALMGDQVDGIPGVDGVGVKTAAQLLGEYGDIEQVLESAACGRIKGKLGVGLNAQAEKARLSRKLVAFKTDMPLGLTWSMLRMPMPQAA